LRHTAPRNPSLAAFTLTPHKLVQRQEFTIVSFFLFLMANIKSK
jgi:hypothetical protein